MSLRAYEQAAQRTESPRDLEYRLFGQVTRSLMEAAPLDNTQNRRAHGGVGLEPAHVVDLRCGLPSVG